MRLKINAFISLLCCIVFVLSQCAVPQSKSSPVGVEIFVSPSGDDQADGTFEQPFKTLERARDEARKQRNLGAKPITVMLREGTYFLDETLHFTAEDSGTESFPLTWKAFNSETVWISGGYPLSRDMFKPLEDEALLARAANEDVQKQLLTVDLSDILTEWPSPIVPDTAFAIRTDLPEIYVGDSPLHLSRWPNDLPNEGYLYADSAEVAAWNDQPSIRLTSNVLKVRAIAWSDDASKSMFVFGMMEADWLSGIYQVASFDRQTGSLLTRGGLVNELMEHPRFYVFNLLEEVDVPGEFVVDMESQNLILLPPENFEESEVILSLLKDPLIQLDGAEYLTFSGLHMGFVRSTPFYASNVHHIRIEDCTMAHSAYQGVILNGATDSIITNSHIFDSAGGAIYLWDGGLRKKLIPSGNIIENNRIHDTNTKRNFYTAAVDCESTGLIIRSNEIYDETHIAIDLTHSNDSLVENNEIHHVCLDSSDSGAIYIGRDPSNLGIVIKNNYFHDIGNTYGGVGQQSIFLDDGTSMPIISGNLFLRASSTTSPQTAAINSNGGQYGIIDHNIFVDLPYAVTLGSWTSNWDRVPLREDGWIFRVYGLGIDWAPDIWNKLTVETDFFSSTWRNHYRQTHWAPLWDYLSPAGHRAFWRLAGDLKPGEMPTLDRHPALFNWTYKHAPSLTNRLENNIGVKIAGDDFWWGGNARASNNFVLDTDVFVDYANGDYRLSAQGLEKIRELIPDFPNFPMERIDPDHSP